MVHQIKTIVAALLLAVLFNACENDPWQPQLLMIPENTFAVMSFDLATLTEKADLEELSHMQMIEDLGENSDTKAIERFLKSTMQDPWSSGLAFHEKMYWFSYMEDDVVYIGMSAGIEDKEDFKDWLEDMFGAAGAPDEVVDGIKDKDQYYYMDIEGVVTAGWDDEKFLLLFGIDTDGDPVKGEAKRELKRAMTEGLGSSIADNEDFKEYYDLQQDWNFWMNMEETTAIVEEIEPGSSMVDYFDFEAFMHGFVEFDKGSITSKYETIFAEGEEPTYTKFFKPGGISKGLLRWFPAETYMVFGMAMTTEDFSGVIEEFSESLPYSMRRSLDMDDWEEADEEIQKELDMSLDELIESFGGEVVASLHGFEMKEVEKERYDYETMEYYTETDEKLIPLFTVGITLNNGELYDKLVSLAGKEEKLLDKGGYYQFTEEIDIYFTKVENVVLMTSDENVIDRALNSGGYTNHLGSSDIGSKLDGKMIHVHVNLNYKTYPELVQDEIEEEFLKDDDEFRLFPTSYAESVLGFFEYISYSSANGTDLIYHVELQNDKTNSLQLIFETIDDFYVKNKEEEEERMKRFEEEYNFDFDDDGYKYEYDDDEYKYDDEDDSEWNEEGDKEI